jgi:two-component system, LuxR family, response regulator FixJ
MDTEREIRPATVFVVDDDTSVRDSLRWLVESVGLKAETFSDAQDLLRKCSPEHPGCFVLDVRMPGMSGLELQEQLAVRGFRQPVIIMTAYGDVPMAVRAMKRGAVYFFEKNSSNQILLEQIQAALKEDEDRRRVEDAGRVVRERYQKLTAREVEVLELVTTGLSSKEVGQQLGVSFKTVEAHRAKIMKKMEADSVPHLIRMYVAATGAAPFAPLESSRAGEAAPV